MENLVQEPAFAYGKKYTLEGFLEFTETSEFKYEYNDGDTLPVAETTQAHAEIADNVHAILKSILKPRGCKSFQESVFLRIKTENSLLLPDVLVTCNADDFSPTSRFVDYPSIIVEVSSETTELFDRSTKWKLYRQIPSLQYYILVSQKEPLVEVYSRPHGQSLFYFQDFRGLATTIDLNEIDIQIPMQEIYAGIEFEELTEKH